ncbi:MAG: phosphoribosylformylglycinamidine synthase subunit PurQ, partial [Bacteroidales bacterium]
VFSPGTVIISAGAEVSDVKKIVSPVVVNKRSLHLFYIDFSFDTYKLGGSAFAQSLDKVGEEAPTVKDAEYFSRAFYSIQQLVNDGNVAAGHDISAGGMITTLLEMTFGNVEGGLEINLDKIKEKDIIKILFSENPGVILQAEDAKAVEALLKETGVGFVKIGNPCKERHIIVKKDGAEYQFGIDYLRDVWFSSSYLLDQKQSGEVCAKERFNNYKEQPIKLRFNSSFTGKLAQYGISACRRTQSGVKAAIIREKGVNGDREMAYSLHLAGFDVKDVHMTDLMSGRETLDDINMIVYVGGFSNSDVLGSAKGWAGGFLWNEKAKSALEKFYSRKDTLSLG